MPTEELPVVRLLLDRQSRHPLLEGFPTAARIGKLSLFLGEAGAAQDTAFLEANDIRAVIALGTGNLAVKPCEVLLIDILDMEDELLLPHFKECIDFLKKHLVQGSAVLVHCVYGQSRSASICVAYLMAAQGKTLLEAYDEVQKARPCISINPGFLRQLELFERMENDPEVMGSTPAHAELRTMVARRQRMKTGVADIVATPQHTRPGNSVCCRKCNYVLCTTRNQLVHSGQDAAASGGLCAGIFIEPMQWMTKDLAVVRNNDGKLLCPSCRAKLGSWNWIGMQLQTFRQPSVSVGSEQNTNSRALTPELRFDRIAQSDKRTRPFERSMGAAVSSVSVGTLAADIHQEVLEVARTINDQTLKEFTLTTQRKFRLKANEFNALFPDIPRDTVEQVFAVFDPRNSGMVDSCELLASIVLAAPQLSRDTKQRAIFGLFNMSTHRVGLMVADEATLLFRSVVVGAAKMLRALAPPTSLDRAADELPRLSFFENLTKALYGEQETLTYPAFAQLCRETPEIEAFMAHWTL
ncbi:hypothetical protein PHYPSEUDO_010160 [Phytophthora pseudosyringae]|uniref:protein-tyrosine-phosphatase n=1 Tax=Phytophthora pseudosyringae TaxID=221518 RepID=A0A8T1W835_9STRA|nr:hypothetical protein PHYPSEUDO_010160 [Phytophthora pseudosyringae]